MKSKTKIVLILILATIPAALMVLYFTVGHRDSSTDTYRDINYGEPTRSEQQAGDNQKEKNIKREKTEENFRQDEASRVAEVIVNSAGEYDGVVEVRAFVLGAYEDGGVCEAVFTKGESRLTVSTTAFKDASSVQCGALDIEKSRFESSGEWSLVVGYKSSQAEGYSEAKTVSIGR